MNRKLIALPSIEDLEREANRTGQRIKLENSKRMYATAQIQIRRAHERMAYAALAIVRPEDYNKIEAERRRIIQQANYDAKQAAMAHFTDECIGFKSEM